MAGGASLQGLVPPGSWDCHVHCFNPEIFPFRSDRAYTPLPASLDSLMSWSPVDNVVIVQATIEENEAGVLAHIAEGHQKWPRKNFYATVVSTLLLDKGVRISDAIEASEMQAAGVRCIRVHGGINAVAVDAADAWKHLTKVAESAAVTNHTWAIAMQLPLRTWAVLWELLVETNPLNKVIIIADHMGCATPADSAEPAFEVFLEMLRQGRTYVKISALHRRSPDDIHAMREIVQRFANTTPDRLLWGSDWPHVNSVVRTLEPTPHLEVDALEELSLIKTWLTEDQWHKMMVENPRRVFGVD